VFLEVETVEGGLGPIFNEASCIACHRGPAPGGASPRSVTRFGRVTNGVFDPLAEKGGPLLQDHSINPAIRETVPVGANLVIRRQTQPLFGLGLVEAIADETILALAARTSVDGVKGRAAIVTDPASATQRVGRFGWKSQHATLAGFSADAYTNEMGVTNRLFPNENAPNGNTALLKQADRVLDPEDTAARADFELAADFMRLLAAPPQIPLTANATAGKALFEKAGCAVCHVPSLTTAVNGINALSEKAVPLYSDLLLHDMGRLSDGMPQGAATGREMRTAPLWGLRASAPYLHDGRADTVEAAIRAHEGEAVISRDRFLKLSPTERAALLEFLGSI